MAGLCESEDNEELEDFVNNYQSQSASHVTEWKGNLIMDFVLNLFVYLTSYMKSKYDSSFTTCI